MKRVTKWQCVECKKWYGDDVEPAEWIIGAGEVVCLDCVRKQDVEQNIIDEMIKKVERLGIPENKPLAFGTGYNEAKEDILDTLREI